MVECAGHTHRRQGQVQAGHGDLLHRPALCHRAAAHPPLQRLSFDLTDDSQPFNLEGPAFDEVAGVLRRRLGVSVFRAGCGSDHHSFEEEYDL